MHTNDIDDTSNANENGEELFAASTVYMTPDKASTPPPSQPHRPKRNPSASRFLTYGHGLALPHGVADSPDDYEGELLAITESLPAEVRAYIAGHTPRNLPAGADSAAAGFIRVAVLAVAPSNKHTADQTTAAISHLTIWAFHSKGLPLKYRLLLSSEVISRWQQETLAGKELSAGTLSNYRGHLSRIAHAMGVELNAKFDPVTRTVRTRPYTAVDVERMLLWSRTLCPEMSRRARALLCLGAGAGLTLDEIVHARASDVILGASMWVKVGEPHARLTPVLDRWKPALRALVEETPPADLLLPLPGTSPSSPQSLTTWLKQQPAKTRPHPTRLRTTWIVEMLRTQTNDANTLAHAGIERGETLAGYLPLLGEVDRARYSALIRINSPQNSVENPPSGRSGGDAAHTYAGRHVRDDLGNSGSAGENS